MNKEILKYKIESTLLAKRLCLCQAEYDLSVHGKWTCDWSKPIAELDRELNELIEKYEVEG